MECTTAVLHALHGVPAGGWDERTPFYGTTLKPRKPLESAVTSKTVAARCVGQRYGNGVKVGTVKDPNVLLTKFNSTSTP
jgi:hypothetical protein